MNVYVISLARSQERRQRIINHMGDHGIAFEFFDAVDGKLEHPLFSDYDYKKCLWLTSGKMPTRGEMGCYGSHYLLWLHCVASNQPIVVIEDDVILNESFKKIIFKIKEDVERFGFVRLEPSEWGRNEVVTERDNYKISLMENNCNGARGYAISPKSASKLIKHRWSLPVDCFIGLSYLHGVNSYVVEPSVICHGQAIETTVQVGFSQTSWYRKPTREVYSLYKKIRIKLTYKKSLRGHHSE
ncbi:TPA: glycosyltransferase family 25 protein [Aeromonas veronii]